jgi:hypothetical protein
MMFCICIKRNNEMVNAAVSDPKAVSMPIQEARAKLRHGDEEEVTRKATKALCWELNKGGLKPCAACADGKAK